MTKTIYAIGDITGPPMLAHKATHEAKIAAEVAAGTGEGSAGAGAPGLAKPFQFSTGYVPALASPAARELRQKHGALPHHFANPSAQIRGRARP